MHLNKHPVEERLRYLRKVGRNALDFYLELFKVLPISHGKVCGKMLPIFGRDLRKFAPSFPVRRVTYFEEVMVGRRRWDNRHRG